MKTHLMTFQNTSIIMGEDLTESRILEDACKTNTVVLLADNYVAELYGKKLQGVLQKAAKEVFLLTFPEGEASKSRSVKESLEDQMQAKGLGRDTTLIGLGGGVTTDLAGFIASTYCRGIPLVLMPTSLLAMVDASIGGKTGVNTPYGKNLIGTFYLPQTLIIDFDFLQSLPPKSLGEGLVEVIKVALTCDEDLFHQIELLGESLFKVGHSLKEIVKKACEIKLKVVAEDFEEKEGMRRILNFGHTVGHALEKFFKYEMPHGCAVAFGVIAESYMALEISLLKKTHFDRVVKVLKPFLEKRNFDIKEVYEYMALDKKSKNQEARFVLIDSIGQALPFDGEYCTSVEQEIVLNALHFIREL
ncbi:MAG: 3-dehydroquinate synthase [Chlamydiae bacterium]|nr:3-dehydroquinate synthase [Chlamydiota bacterium]